MLSLAEKIAFVVLLIFSLIWSWRSFSSMVKTINTGMGELGWRNPGTALLNFLSQRTVLKTRFLTSLLHSMIAWAFILYMLVNIGDVLTGFLSSFTFLGTGLSGNLYRLFVDVFSMLAMISVLYFILRRFIIKPEKMMTRENVMLLPSAPAKIKLDSLLVALFILFHIGFRFLGESVHLAAAGQDNWQPLASAVSALWMNLTPAELIVWHHLFWWLAIGLILIFIPYFPKSKHAHLFMGPINYLTKPERNAFGTLNRIDFEADEVEQFGAATVKDFHKSQILDAYACIMCNRCQEVCPAYQTGKELSPAALEINKRIYLNQNEPKIVAGNDEIPLLEFGLSSSALWACTTCAACMEICPVGNEPMIDILHIRRDRVLMESDFPKQLQGAFNGMERNANPWNINDDRLKWAASSKGLDVKTVKQNPDFDILYWVGCAGAFDQKGQEIATAFTRILNHCDVNFAVLGNDEKCTGDSARRAGNEYLFSMLAEENVARLNEAGVKKIVATCPHCLHTLRNEYPQFGGNYEVLHHSQLIENLISDGKLTLNIEDRKKVAFHDPCYLGRHNRVFDAPRAALKKSGADVLELGRNRENSFCCGAGGGQMWKEEEVGSEAVRRERFAEVQQTGSDVLCTACPFCLTMMRDAGNELQSEIVVKDLAQVIAERLDE